MRRFSGPFLADEALSSGALTFHQLRRFHEAVYPGVWVPRGSALTPEHNARAAWLWSRRRGAAAGLSASATLGARWIDDRLPAELIHVNRRSPNGIVVHSDALLAGETRIVNGMPVTTPARTAFDLGRRLPLLDGVQRIDALMNAANLKVAEVEDVVVAHPGVRGLRQLRETLGLVDGGAESPYESATRLLLVRSGFPAPESQIEILDEYGRVFARIDMGGREYRVGLDFEGAQHWTDPRQRDWDVERYARMPDFGWIDLRLTARMLHTRLPAFLDRLGRALISRGCPQTW